MKPVRALIFGIDDLYPKLEPYYNREIERGNLIIEGYAIVENGIVKFYKNLKREPLTLLNFDKVIISSLNNYVTITKFLSEKMMSVRGGGVSPFIDGRVFQVPEFDFPRFLTEGIAYGKNTNEYFSEATTTIYPKIYLHKNMLVSLGSKSYIANSFIEGNGSINIGNFTSISWKITFELALSLDHNHKILSHYGLSHLDWPVDISFYPNVVKYQQSTINIGSDVWIGRGCKLKTSNLDKPLNIGNGAVIASDSVVVRDVPPYAIVGGNPAKVIKYRFDQDTIESLERIAWWNWDLVKIHDNFHLFKNIPEFIRIFDK